MIRTANASEAIKLFVDPFMYAMATHIYTEHRATVLKTTVYLATLDVEKETQSPKYSWSAFLSNLGGVMGLCTGFSLLSFLELVELLVDLCGHALSVTYRRVCRPGISPGHV